MKITFEIADEATGSIESIERAAKELMLNGYLWPAVVLGEVAKEMRKQPAT